MVGLRKGFRTIKYFRIRVYVYWVLIDSKGIFGLKFKIYFKELKAEEVPEGTLIFESNKGGSLDAVIVYLFEELKNSGIFELAKRVFLGAMRN